MNAHTREDQSEADRRRLRLEVAEHYEAKRIRRVLLKELHLLRVKEINPRDRKPSALRNITQKAQDARRWINDERLSLGLFQIPPGREPADSHCRWLMGQLLISREDYVEVKIMSVEETHEMISSVLKSGRREWFKMPRYYRELVNLKGIQGATGAVLAEMRLSRKRGRYRGDMLIINAREIRGGWLDERGVRAFKVSAIPNKSISSWLPVVGYVVRSTAINKIVPAFDADLSKAVSLCERRVKAEFLKQMGE